MKHSLGGVMGTALALTLHDVSDLTSAAAGVATVVYMVVATICTLRKRRK